VKLEETLRVLYDAGVEFVLIGGVAMQLQGSAYLTEDLDFCYARTRRNIEALASALQEYHPHLRNAPAGLPFNWDARTIESGLNFTLTTDLGALDFLGEIAGLGNYDAVNAASETLSIFGLNHRVLSIPGLIAAKRAAGRKKDLEAIIELEGLLDLKRKSGI
jgi:predicted nucleotidyltransferase